MDLQSKDLSQQKKDSYKSYYLHSNLDLEIL